MSTTRDEMLDRLRRMPDRLARLVDGKSEADLRRAGAGGDWGAVEHLANLQDFEEVTLERIDRVITGETPELEEFDTDLRAIELDYHAQDPFETLERFREHRRELVERLEHLAEEDWQRTALHAKLGLITLEDLVEQIDAYDQRCLQVLRDNIL